MLVQSKDVRVDLSAVDGGASESELDILGERTRGWQWQQRRKEVECLRILASLGLCRLGGGGGGSNFSRSHLSHASCQSCASASALRRALGSHATARDRTASPRCMGTPRAARVSRNL